MISTRSIPFFAALLAFGEMNSYASSITMSIQEAARKGLVQLSIRAKGGHCGKVISMKVKNTSSNDLRLLVNAGLRLDSQKEQEQDILVTKDEVFALNAKAEKTADIFGMCCQAHNSSPREKSVYLPGKMADSLLQKLARYIADHKLHEDFTAQQAVWCVSDNESLGAISGDDTAVYNPLRRFVSKITGRAIPAYRVRYGNGSSTDVLGRPTFVEGHIAYTLPANGHATIRIFDQNGKVVQTIMNEICSERGEYRIDYVFRTKDLPAGKYFAQLTLDGMIQKEESIEI